MNKKAFTLVELLAVIVLVAIVSLIGYEGVTTIKQKMDQSAFEKKLELVLSDAERYGQDNKSLINSTLTINVQNLLDTGYLATDEKDTNGKKSINHYINDASLNSLEIKLSLSNNRVHACIIKNDSLLLQNKLSYDDFKNSDLFC